MRQRTALTLLTRHQQHSSHACRHACADSLHIAIDELHRVVDTQPCIHATTGRVNIDADVLAEKNRAISAETALDIKIDQEIANRIADVDAEEERAKDAELALSNKIDADVLAEKNRAVSAETALDTKINQEIVDREAAVLAEENRAKTAESGLTTLINTEAANRVSGDTMLSHLIEDEIENRISGDTILQNAISSEEARAREIETRLETWLNNEVSRAEAAEGLLNTAITNETLRAQAADNELYRNIADVSASSIAADSRLEIKINEESSARTLADNALEDKIDDEITRSTNKDNELSLALQQEIADRQQGDAELAEEIRGNKLTFDDTASIDFNNPYLENNVVTANVKLQEGENIIKCGSGLYATVNLSYDPARNTIKLVTSNGEQEAIQLNTVGSLIDGIEYDPVNRALVVKYHDAAGNQHQTSFPVNQLFNDWVIDNPSSKSAVKLVKTAPAEPDDADTLSGFVLITDDRDGDGKPDAGSDNLVEIRNNGLYVCGSAMTEAQDVAKCVKNEVKVFEKAVIGHQISEECGSGYTYEPNAQATYINSASSFNNADFILDQSIKNVEDKIDDAAEEIECIDSKADKIYELLYGEGQTMPECGEGAHYQPYVGSCIISAATSFNEADQMLNDQICEILTMWVSGITCTNESEWVEDGMNKKIQVHTRLSHGRFAQETDDEIFIKDLYGEYIDPTNIGFTDTNVLRIVCLDTEPSGTTPSVESKQNGIYLSNEWDCGLYYGPSDTQAKANAAAAGYKTDYLTDEASTAHDYNYMNNVRITPPQS